MDATNLADQYGLPQLDWAAFKPGSMGASTRRLAQADRTGTSATSTFSAALAAAASYICRSASAATARSLARSSAPAARPVWASTIRRPVPCSALVRSPGCSRRW